MFTGAALPLGAVIAVTGKRAKTRAVPLLPQVRDAVVVGVPHERFGESVSAVVELQPGQMLSLDEITNHARGRLAGHKVPRHLIVVETMGRGPNGKADYPGLRRLAQERVLAIS
jgi:fatty-acyl-CoA synthase